MFASSLYPARTGSLAEMKNPWGLPCKLVEILCPVLHTQAFLEGQESHCRDRKGVQGFGPGVALLLNK